MKGRCRGGKSKDRGKYWNVACDFDSWIGFRTWALDKGYRLGMELDREDSLKPYDRDNCRWIIRKDHLAKTLKAHKPNCPCPFCKPKPSVTWVDPECGF